MPYLSSRQITELRLVQARCAWSEGYEITELDTISGEIRGTFQLSLVVDSNSAQNDPYGLDTILLKNGIFHTRLK